MRGRGLFILLWLFLSGSVHAELQQNMLADVLKMRSQETDLASQVLQLTELQRPLWSVQDGERFLPNKQSLVPNRSGPTVVHFFATWCKPCQKEMPAVLWIFHSLAEQRLPARMIVLAQNDTVEDIRMFRQQYPEMGAALPLYDDSGVTLTGMLGRQMQDGPPGLPVTLLVDRCGVVRQAFVGSLLGRRNALLNSLCRLAIATNRLACPDELALPAGKPQM